MFNVTVLKMKDIMKYLVGILITIFIVVYSTRYFSTLKNNTKTDNIIENKEQIKMKGFKSGNLISCLDKTIPTISNVDEKDEKDKKTESTKYLEGFLKTEISSIEGIEKSQKDSYLEDNTNVDTEDNKTENNEQKEEKETEKVELANTSGIKTEVVTPNPISENYNAQYGNVKIKNQTTYELTQEMLKPDITIDNKNILLFHTHSCESYTPSEKYQYTQTGNYRTTDLNYTVTRVGTELENYLKQYNLNVVHNTSYHDYPSYTGSYTRSLKTVENMLQNTSSDIIIDLHRDAIGSRPDYAPTVKIGEDSCAQIMFVIGTNEGGLWHPNWNQNLKFAVKIQEKAEEMYPRII